jgi:hypothetical protein
MAIVILTSASGSPGATTLAVGLALTWPRSVILADCDPGAHQAVLAGFLAGRSAGGKGLLRVAEAHRDRRPLREVVLDQCEVLAEDAGHLRLFLPGFTKPGSAAHFGGVWADLTEAFDRLSDTGYDVIIDAGRLTAAGLPAPLVERAALSCLVLRSNLRSVLSARVHLPTIRDQDRRTGTDGTVGLILIGESEPYSHSEVGKALGAPVLGVVAHDPRPAAHLSDGRPRPRRFDSSPLVRSLHGLGTTMASRLERSADLIRSSP